jgi:hypothetical protein
LLVLVAIGSKHPVYQPRGSFEGCPTIRAQIPHTCGETTALVKGIEDKFRRHPGRSRRRVGGVAKPARIETQYRAIQFSNLAPANGWQPREIIRSRRTSEALCVERNPGRYAQSLVESGSCVRAKFLLAPVLGTDQTAVSIRCAQNVEQRHHDEPTVVALSEIGIRDDLHAVWVTFEIARLRTACY